MENSLFHVFAALAKFERSLIRERAYTGLVAARASDRSGNRKPKLGETQMREIRAALERSGHSRGGCGAPLRGVAYYSLQARRHHHP